MDYINTLTYSTISHCIKVSATPKFIEEESNPKENCYVWTYHIHIENMGKNQVKLLNRHWIIINAKGQIQEVKGEGVVGVQPIIAPNEEFEYHSETQLATANGFMLGKYEMAQDDGKLLEVDIPAFSLDSPESRRLIN